MLASAVIESVSDTILDNCAKTLCDRYILSHRWVDTFKKNIRIIAEIQARSKLPADLPHATKDCNEKNAIMYDTFLDDLSRLVKKPCIEIDHDIMRCLAHECACLIALSL